MAVVSGSGLPIFSYLLCNTIIPMCTIKLRLITKVISKLPVCISPLLFITGSVRHSRFHLIDQIVIANHRDNHRSLTNGMALETAVSKNWIVSENCPFHLCHTSIVHNSITLHSHYDFYHFMTLSKFRNMHDNVSNSYFYSQNKTSHRSLVTIQMYCSCY